VTASDFYERFRTEVAKVIVGQDEAIRLCALAVVVGGHLLLEGVPGTGKMPADIVGTSVYDLQSRTFKVRRGPVFTNILLADEINRAPAKVQAALLEAMEESGVSLEGEQHPLPDPFLVLATQNPVEYEGTYPLPEAQQDRFLFKVVLGYPSAEQELEMLRRWNAGVALRDPARAGVEPVLGDADLREVRRQVGTVRMDAGIGNYIVDLARASRSASELVLGASPRAEVLLLLAAKAAAALAGRDYVTPDDIKGLLAPTFRHRLLLRPEAEVAGQTADSVLAEIVAMVTPPR
jgi:MoxR-like ATPase